MTNIKHIVSSILTSWPILINTVSVLTDKQHGFRSKHSCESQLILTVHDLASSLDNRSQINMVIMDFSKAFDSIPHNHLLLKLNRYGIQNNTNRLISNFLKQRTEGRRPVVPLDLDLCCFGHPSGHGAWTIALPLLHKLSSQLNNLSATVSLFADDCVIYLEIQNDIDPRELQQYLATLRTWESNGQLSFNCI